MEAKLYEWFQKQRLKILSVTVELIKAKEKSINEHFKEKMRNVRKNPCDMLVIFCIIS